MKSKFKNIFILFITFFPFIPVFALAQAPTDFASLLGVFVGLLNLLVPLLISAAVLFFLWGIAIFILKGASETEREKGKQIMFWGIVGLFVMVSVWGLVGLLEETFFGSSIGSSNQNIQNLL